MTELDIDRLLAEAEPEEPQDHVRASRSVVFFDLVGSTARKLELGHRAGVMASAKHNKFCALVVGHFNGEVLKELGDGVLAVFEDPLDAVRAADAVRSGLARTDLSTKVGLTFGLVDLVEVNGRPDALGGIVDRAARIQAAASPDQVLIDRGQLDVISDYIGDVDEIRLGSSYTAPLRGVGDIELWPVESSAAEPGPRRLPERLRVYGTGRLGIADKLRFMNYAESEVVEFGTGLTTFVSYFTNLNPEIWKTPILDLLHRGVDLHCYALDFDSELARSYLESTGEQKYAKRATEALQQLRRIRDDLNAQSDAGKVDINLYQSIPAFYALAVDVNSERSGMHVSPYLRGVPRAECPVFEFSRASEPDLFERFSTSMGIQTEDSRPVP